MLSPTSIILMTKIERGKYTYPAYFPKDRLIDDAKLFELMDNSS